VLALKAGVDIDMMADAYRKGLPRALEQGRVTIAEIDTSVRRVLRLKERLGLFDDPYRRGSTNESAATIAARRELARDVGRRAIVLLKNDRDTLPLTAPRRLAVIGPLADAAIEMRGPWWGAGEHGPHVDVLSGLRSNLPDTEIRHAPGVAINDDDDRGIKDAVALCDGADAVLLCLGESSTMSGEAASRAFPDPPGRQRALAEAAIERAHARGIPVVAILFSGRPLTIAWLAEKADAIVAAWFLGSEAGNAICDVLTGAVSPSGRTPISWPRTVGQAPIFFGERPSGRPMNPDDYYTSKYHDVPNTPLYPFGHGLGYGKFSYSNLRVTPDVVREHERIDVHVDLRNDGARRAEETVFLFTRDPVASVTRPLLELRSVAKITLAPGASGTVSLSFAASELRFPGADLSPLFEAGTLEILVGPNADRAQLLSATIELQD
jgi:beta-glucosidase